MINQWDTIVILLAVAVAAKALGEITYWLIQLRKQRKRSPK